MEAQNALTRAIDTDELKAEVHFTNEKTGEFLFYDLTLKAEPPDPLVYLGHRLLNKEAPNGSSTMMTDDDPGDEHDADEKTLRIRLLRDRHVIACVTSV